MNICKPFILRPIGTTLLAMGLALAGILAFQMLPVASLPQIEFPTISVQAGLPGASAEIMATSVATPLERQLGRIAGITQMTSSSTLGSTRISVQFDLSRDIDGAANDVQAAINAAQAQLPANLPNNPTYRKVNPADAPIFILALSSPIETREKMYDAASSVLQQTLSQIPGVGQIIIGGSSLPAVRVELNPTALNHYGISLNQVRNQLSLANHFQAIGQLNNTNAQSNIVSNSQLTNAEHYRSLIIHYANAAPVRLGDVAEITNGVEDVRNAGLSNGKPAVLLVIFKQPGANVIETVDHIKKRLPELRSMLNGNVQLNIAMDRTPPIRASLHDVEKTLMISIFLVILVVYIFLRNPRSVIIPGIVVPLSLLGTFSIMYLLHYSLDNLSLMALTISTGFVVDDAIVVLENIARHVEAGMAPIPAAMKGTQEVGFTVVAMSLSLIAVFIPILLMRGIVGRLFQEFAVTLSIAILVSLIISLTVTPMMSAYLLKRRLSPHPAQPQHQHPYYARSLSWALQHPRFMLSLFFGAIILNACLFYIVPKGFFPQQDTGRLNGSIQADQDASFQSLKKKLSEFVDIITRDPAVESVEGFIGGFNSGSVFITLKPPSQRKLSADAIINRLRKQLALVPGATLFLQPSQDLVIGGRQSSAQFQFTLSSDHLAELNTWVPRIMNEIATLPGVMDLNSDQRNHGLQLWVAIDHDAAAQFGISSRDIDTALYSAFGQSQISTLYTPMNQYHVVMEVAPPFWQYPETLNVIQIPSNTGAMIPLSLLAHFEPRSTLLAVNHQGLLPAATLSFNLKPGISLGSMIDAIDKKIQSLQLPPSMHVTFQGTTQAFQASLKSEVFLILAALVAVYIVLGMLYESLIHPLTILSTLPSAGVGALLALFLTGTDLNLISTIGIILLIGIVKKNAIMMIDAALLIQRTQHLPPQTTIYQAALLRFRPIMMTTCAALLGACPLAFDYGVGTELRRPLGIAIIGGLILSQLLTLYTTPVIYLAFERLKLRHSPFIRRDRLQIP